MTGRASAPALRVRPLARKIALTPETGVGTTARLVIARPEIVGLVVPTSIGRNVPSGTRISASGCGTCSSGVLLIVTRSGIGSAR